MNISLLNTRIEVQRNSQTVDQYGNHKNTWESYWFCFATVSGETPKEDTEAGQTVDDSRVDFTVRYCRASSAITSTGYRVLFRGEIYDILGVNHMNYKHRAVKLLCRKVRR